MRLLSILIGLATVLLTSCSGGGGSDLEDTLAVNRAPYVVLDLTTGERSGYQSLDSLPDNFDRTTGNMIFRRIDGGPRSLGSPSTELGRQSDEDSRTVEIDSFYIGIYEVTVGQWTTLMGSDTTAPWDGLAAPLGNSDSSAPAHALGHDDALAIATAADNLAAELRISLPSDNQWEAACRANNSTSQVITTAYNFAAMRTDDNGDEIAPPTSETIAAHAWLFVSAGNDGGPQSVGGLSASPAGLYDMHGNVWEWTSDQHIRGGAWRSDALEARASNKVSLDNPNLGHPLVGVRLVMMP